MVEGTAWEYKVKARLVEHDEAVLTELYDQFGSYVYGLAARVIGDRRVAEDVTQDVFLSLWERPDAFSPDRGRLRTFVGMLAHRRAIDYVRREEARRRRAARDAAARLPVPDVDEMAMALVTAERVRAEVERLPSEQREAIELAYFGGRTYRQVADELGIPEGTAKSRMRLGLRRIADALGARTRPGRGVYDVVVVGGGPAGLAAAVSAESEGLRTALVEPVAMGGQAGTSSRSSSFPAGTPPTRLPISGSRSARAGLRSFQRRWKCLESTATPGKKAFHSRPTA